MSRTPRTKEPEITSQAPVTEPPTTRTDGREAGDPRAEGAAEGREGRVEYGPGVGPARRTGRADAANPPQVRGPVPLIAEVMGRSST